LHLVGDLFELYDDAWTGKLYIYKIRSVKTPEIIFWRCLWSDRWHWEIGYKSGGI